MNNDILKYINNITSYSKTALNILVNKPKTNEKQILDPLTTIIKIALYLHSKCRLKSLIFSS